MRKNRVLSSQYWNAVRREASPFQPLSRVAADKQTAGGRNAFRSKSFSKRDDAGEKDGACALRLFFDESSAQRGRTTAGSSPRRSARLSDLTCRPSVRPTLKPTPTTTGDE